MFTHIHTNTHIYIHTYLYLMLRRIQPQLCIRTVSGGEKKNHKTKPGLSRLLAFPSATGFDEHRTQARVRKAEVNHLS